MLQGIFLHSTACAHSQSERVEQANVSKASHAQIWFTIETFAASLQCFIRGSRLHKSTCMLAAAESFNLRLICSRPDLAEGINPAIHTCAPLRRKGCILEMPSCRCLILGRRWPRISSDNPTRASSLAALQLPGGATEQSRVACRCKPPSISRSVVGLLLETALKTLHAARKMLMSKISSDVVQHVLNLSTLGNAQSSPKRRHVVSVNDRCTICDPHDVPNCTVARYMEHPPVSYLLV
jgi:hypothetical protein